MFFIKKNVFKSEKTHLKIKEKVSHNVLGWFEGGNFEDFFKADDFFTKL